MAVWMIALGHYQDMCAQLRLIAIQFVEMDLWWEMKSVMMEIMLTARDARLTVQDLFQIGSAPKE